jgi:hypothetical protein
MTVPEAGDNSETAEPKAPVSTHAKVAGTEEVNASMLPHTHVPHQSVSGWRDFLVHVAMIAIGVLLALLVEQWREHGQQRQLASEFRAALRAEVIANREVIIARMRRTAQLYTLVQAHSEQVGSYVFERLNRPLVLDDAAWTMAVETGALRWLTPAERVGVAGAYTEQRHVRELADQEMTKWTELAAFESTPGLPEEKSSRERAIRIWQAFAQRTQLAECVTAGRYERALGSTVQLKKLIEFCASLRPDRDPAIIYSEWKRRGWASSSSLP